MSPRIKIRPTKINYSLRIIPSFHCIETVHCDNFQNKNDMSAVSVFLILLTAVKQLTNYFSATLRPLRGSICMHARICEADKCVEDPTANNGPVAPLNGTCFGVLNPLDKLCKDCAHFLRERGPFPGP